MKNNIKIFLILIFISIVCNSLTNADEVKYKLIKNVYKQVYNLQQNKDIQKSNFKIIKNVYKEYFYKNAEKNNNSNNTDNFSIKLYPNPASNFINISFNSVIASEINFRLSNSSGQTVYNSNYNVNKGENEIQFNIIHLNSGIYYYAIEQSCKLVSGTVIVLK